MQFQTSFCAVMMSDQPVLSSFLFGSAPKSCTVSKPPPTKRVVMRTTWLPTAAHKPEKTRKRQPPSSPMPPTSADTPTPRPPPATTSVRQSVRGLASTVTDRTIKQGATTTILEVQRTSSPKKNIRRPARKPADGSDRTELPHRQPTTKTQPPKATPSPPSSPSTPTETTGTLAQLFLAVLSDKYKVVEKMLIQQQELRHGVYDSGLKLPKGKTEGLRAGWGTLHCGCFKGHLDTVKVVVKQHPTLVTMKTKEGQTPLHIATFANHPDIVSFLLKQDHTKILPDETNQGPIWVQQTSLHIAAIKGHAVIAQLLTEHNADVNFRNKNASGPNTALQLAVVGSHSDVVRILLNHHVVNLETTENGKTALFRACDVGNDEIVDMLVSAGANVNRQHESSRETPLYRACRQKHTATVMTLLRGGADCTLQSCWKLSTPFHVAEPEEEIIRSLLQFADQKKLGNVTSSHCTTPLQLAIAHDNAPVLKLLLEGGFPLFHNTYDALSNHPVFLAAMTGNTEMLKCLYPSTPKRFIDQKTERTPLHVACAHGHIEAVRVLLKAGLPVDKPDYGGNSCLHIAAAADHPKVVAVLIDEGKADPDIKNRLLQDSTPMHVAAKRGNIDVIKALGLRGADANCKRKSKQGGRTPLDIAKQNDFGHIVTLLQSFGAVEDYADSSKLNIRKRAEEAKYQMLQNMQKMEKLKQQAKEQSTSTTLPSKQSTNSVFHSKLPPRGAWKSCRIFISSTFEDMQHERAHLVNVVIPSLKLRCAAHRIHIVEVDLRWGVTAEEAKSGKVLQICLDEVCRCQIFLGLVGTRAGWIPTTVAPEVENKYGWEYGLAVTHMEAKVGVLGTNTMNGGCKYNHFYSTAKSDNSDQVTPLHRDLFASGIELQPLTSLDAFEDDLVQKLWDDIQHEFQIDEFSDNHNKQDDALEQDRLYHDTFMHSRVHHFVGRTNVLSSMNSYVYGYNRQPLVITAVPGAGKSALMAKFSCGWVDKKELFTIPYFVGGSPNSTSIRHLLWRCCKELQLKFSVEKQELPHDVSELKNMFVDLLQSATNYCNVLLIIDALNQLDDTFNAQSMDWLPQPLPDGVRVVCSTLAGSCLDSLRNRGVGHDDEVELELLSLSERQEIVSSTLSTYNKHLTDNQMSRLMNKQPGALNPLYLVVATEELRRWGSFDTLDQRIDGFPDDIAALFEQVLERLESEHTKTMLEPLLVSIETSRGGIPELVMKKLLGDLSHINWGKLMASLTMFLKPIGNMGENQLDFFHRQLAKAVNRRYLSDTTSLRQAHKRLADWFLKEADPNMDCSFSTKESQSDQYSRRLAFSEVIYHLRQSGQVDKAVQCLMTLEFIEAKCWNGMAFSLIDDYLDTEVDCDGNTLDSLVQWRMFVCGNIHVFRSHPLLTYQQAMNVAPTNLVNQQMKRSPKGRPLIKWNNKPLKESPCTMTLAGHSGALLCVAASQKGDVIISADSDGNIKLWDFRTGRTISTLKGGGDSTNNIQQEASTGTGQFSDTIIDSLDSRTRSDRVQHGTFVGQNKASAALHGAHSLDVNKINGVCIDPHNSEWCCSISHSGYLCLWSIQKNGKLLQTEFVGQQYPIHDIAALKTKPGGVIFGIGRNIQIWEINVTSPEPKLERMHDCQVLTNDQASSDTAITCVDVNTTTTAVIGTNDKMIYSVNIGSSGGLLQVTGSFPGHTRGVNHVQFSPTKPDVFVSCSQDRSIRLWSLATKGTIAVDAANAHNDNVRQARFNHDGSRVITCGWDKRIVVLSSDDLRVVCSWEAAHSHWINAACFCKYHNRTTYVVSASEDKTVKIWNLDSWIQRNHEGLHSDQTQLAHDKLILACKYSPNGKYLLTSSWDYTAKIWEKRGEKWESIRTVKHDKRCNGSCWSPDGSSFVTASSDKSVTVWETDTGLPLLKLHKHTDGVFCVSYSPNGELIASAGQDHDLIVWDASSGEVVSLLTGHTDWVNCLCFAPDSFRVVSGSRDLSIKIWDVYNGMLLNSIDNAHKEEVYDISFSLSGEHIVSASRDKTLKVWDGLSYQGKTEMIGHENEIDGLWVMDNMLLASACADGTIRVWSMETGKELWAFFCEGQVMAVTTKKKTGKVWSVVAADSMGRLYDLTFDCDGIV